MSIQSFKNIEIQHFFEKGIVPKKAEWQNVSKIVLRKLDMLNAANSLGDLKVPPNNRLEKLRGDLIDYYSIRINDQWRIIFKWIDIKNESGFEVGAFEVEIIDYHF
jgi:proteic killer suppression protein